MQVKKRQIDNFSLGREIPCIQMKAETEQHKSTNVCYPLHLNKSVNPDLYIYLSVDVNIAKGTYTSKHHQLQCMHVHVNTIILYL